MLLGGLNTFGSNIIKIDFLHLTILIFNLGLCACENRLLSFNSGIIKFMSTFRDIILDIACKTFFLRDKLQKARHFRQISPRLSSLFHFNPICFHFQFSSNNPDSSLSNNLDILLTGSKAWHEYYK